LHQILVINLPSAGARRRLMQAQLDLPGMPPYRFIDALDGRQLDAPQLSLLYDDTAARRHLGRSMTASEIGCAHSHLGAYRHMVESGIALGLVLEDDALLGHRFLPVLGRLVAMLDPQGPQVILLSHVVRYRGWRGRRVDEVYSLYRPYEAYGAHAYLITLAGARSMLSTFDRVHTVADDWRYFVRSRTLNAAALIPYLVGTSPLSSQSLIGDVPLRIESPPGERWPGRAVRVAREYFWQKLLFQFLAKPLLGLRKQEQTW
jgi:glycosyl transferase, family 25